MIEKKLESLVDSSYKNSDKKIKTIIFDLGNVVIPYNIHQYARNIYKILRFKKLEKEEAQEISASEKLNLMRMYEKGMPQEEFYNEMNKFRIPFGKNLIKLLEKSTYLPYKPISLEMSTLLKQLKKDYSLAALSNITEPHKKYVLKNYLLRELFDYLFFSCDLGMRKPEDKIFEFVLERVNSKPYETVFIDDFKPNVEAASRKGINSILFSSVDRIDELRNKLKELNAYVC